MQKHRLERIEQSIFSYFGRRETSRLLTKEVFENLVEFANADLVRAFEDLEKRLRLLIRYTDNGHDWISLTPEGAEYAGVNRSEQTQPTALPHPPKSSTTPPNL